MVDLLTPRQTSLPSRLQLEEKTVSDHVNFTLTLCVPESERRIGLLCSNSPINYTDASGLDPNPFIDPSVVAPLNVPSLTLTLPSSGGCMDDSPITDNPFGNPDDSNTSPAPPQDWLTQFEQWWDSLGISSQDAINAASGLASMGSTGRTIPNTLNEQLAMQQAMSNPAAGKVLSNIVMNDARWPASQGWVKMEQNINGVSIHYVRNTITGAVDDFKFK